MISFGTVRQHVLAHHCQFHHGQKIISLMNKHIDETEKRQNN
ncbi:hypothetical protein LSH36_14g07076 [Paralvinella palmiformis]|uniref:Uncharacterized protein n=1 Tax=Paralvinella palmiformis TaxID=53620 RepID=A0AAD9NHT5_9ANNE|nr:hypothetical protein LSH36_14g07076 [Paralvinella palmiformis]